jgi:hypothetical protein
MVTEQEAQKDQKAWMAGGRPNSAQRGTIAITDI